MYRNAELRTYQYYVNPTWTGGVYASPSIAGSRSVSFKSGDQFIYSCAIYFGDHSPGSLIAGTWAAMQYMGSEYVICRFCFTQRAVSYIYSVHSGYLESCKSIVGATRAIAKTITTDIPELYVLGNPPASVVAFASKHPQVNIREVGDVMSKKGWHLNAIVQPAAVHIAVTVSNTPFS